MCLTPVEDMAPERIREIRLRENASQAVFARHLNVTTGLVSQWERGEKRPRGASLKLLTLVAKNGSGVGCVSFHRGGHGVAIVGTDQIPVFYLYRSRPSPVPARIVFWRHERDDRAPSATARVRKAG